jgi:hypothetical protein
MKGIENKKGIINFKVYIRSALNNVLNHKFFSLVLKRMKIKLNKQKF